jgi:hypothetical protein
LVSFSFPKSRRHAPGKRSVLFSSRLVQVNMPASNSSQGARSQVNFSSGPASKCSAGRSSSSVAAPVSNAVRNNSSSGQGLGSGPVREPLRRKLPLQPTDSSRQPPVS